MKDAENIRSVEALGVDMIGLIFFPNSPRFVDTMPSYMPQKEKRVGVFVNADVEQILQTAEQYKLSTIQLHGDEPKETCNKLRSEGYHLIKAFQIAEAEDLKKTSEYNGLCDYYLFDTKSSSYGGTGKTFNWNVLQHYTDNTLFLLSGGISLASMDSLLAFDHPQCVGFDLNSRFEISPGLKDPILIKQFINRIVTR